MLAGVTSGQRPSLDEGLDWLQRQGYRTVLHLHLPGVDDSADRKQAEQRGLKYLHLEVAPQTLTHSLVQEFGRTVGERNNQPLFVYDRDGSLTGGLWYLYFRTAQMLCADTAAIRARPLGYRDDLSEAHRLMWLAVQAYLRRI